MTKHIFIGPQGEPVQCTSAEEARRLTASNRKHVAPTQRGPQGEIIVQPDARPHLTWTRAAR
jgi:hypothetical protein